MSVLGGKLEISYPKFLFFLLLLCSCSPISVVNGSILEESREDEDEAHDQVDVNSLDIGDSWQRWPHTRTDSGHCEHRGYAYNYYFLSIIPNYVCKKMTHFTPKYTNELKISFLISGFLALISIHNKTYSFLARFFLNDSNCTFQPPDYHHIYFQHLFLLIPS